MSAAAISANAWLGLDVAISAPSAVTATYRVFPFAGRSRTAYARTASPVAYSNAAITLSPSAWVTRAAIGSGSASGLSGRYVTPVWPIGFRFGAVTFASLRASASSASNFEIVRVSAAFSLPLAASRSAVAVAICDSKSLTRSAGVCWGLGVCSCSNFLRADHSADKHEDTVPTLVARRGRNACGDALPADRSGGGGPSRMPLAPRSATPPARNRDNPRMASYTVNRAAVEKARALIEAKQYVLDSEWNAAQPRAEQENAFLEKHSWEEYAAWHLGLTEGANDETKARHAFVSGDFRRVHRMGLISCVYRASEWHHKEIDSPPTTSCSTWTS